ncbi:MAG: aldo/keto reductase [Rhodospirillaceae bacterium]
MKSRSIAGVAVSEIGLGCMTLNHALYGPAPTEEKAKELLLAALDLGVTHFDTAALYGSGRNEELLGKVLHPFRKRVFLASKCGLTSIDGKRVIDGRPETLKRTCDESLRRLRTDVIDLYYLHRLDRSVPIEDSVGALARLVAEGKIRSIGLSEVSAATLRRAHAVHPIAAMQSEYSLWTRNPEIALLEACGTLGVALVAFSPLARGFMAGAVREAAQFENGDLRRTMPRFQDPNLSANLRLLDAVRAIASEVKATLAQVALAWVLEQDPCVIAIPGTTSIDHLKENVALQPTLGAEVVSRLSAIVNQRTVKGARYPEATQRDIDTEEFA